MCLFRKPGKSFGDAVVFPAVSQVFSEGGQAGILVRIRGVLDSLELGIPKGQHE